MTRHNATQIGLFNMTEKILPTLEDAIKHADKEYKASKAPKQRKARKPFKFSNKIRASNIVPSDEYRENYERVFGHK